ncbi:hypothetical protein ABMX64_22175 [Vibrio vulnificus]|uniref:hypothetical protein n=1 Tax=Vibrio vulnificus TaxID=672 RepID=UPI00405930E0
MLADRNELQKNYEKALFSALTQFQFVESLLRTYIATSYDVIRLKIDGSDTLCYEFNEKDIETAGLQRLNTNFRKLCKNKPLHSKIKKVCEARNQLAHDACFQNFCDRMSGISDDELHKKSCEIYAYAGNVAPIVTELLRELKLLQGEHEQLTKQSR